VSADGAFGGKARSAAEPPSPEELADFDLNDWGNAMRLVRMVGGQIRKDGSIDLTHATLLYLRQRGWIGFNGRFWDLEHGESLARRRAAEVARALFAQMRVRADRIAKRIMERQAEPDPAKEGEAPAAGSGAKATKKKADQVERAAGELFAFAEACGNNGRMTALLKVAESYLEVDLDAFDQDPYALNCRNGTLKFSRQLQDCGKWKASVRWCDRHDPADRITRMCDVVYQPDAKAPAFDGLIRTAQPIEENLEAMHRVFGYAATGCAYEQTFVIFQGKGGDGKSTIVGAVRKTLGSYAQTCAVETFLDTGLKRGADASPDLARLAGDTRLISTGEPPRNSRLNTGAVKSFTGGAPITARELRQGIFEFTPIGKVILECNNKPNVPDTDDGIWRRLLPILFEIQIPKEKQDLELPAKLDAERPGILNWLIAGVLKWMEGGLLRPQSVKDALEDYRRSGNPFAEWWAECVVVDPDAKTPATAFFKSYKDYCDEQGHDKPMSQTTFGRALGDLQILVCGKDSSGKKLRRGARLRTAGELIAPAQGESAGGPKGSDDGYGPPTNAYGQSDSDCPFDPDAGDWTGE
jgi:putative DNA primase/helicase